MAPAVCAPASVSACRPSDASGDHWPRAIVPVLLRAPRAEESVVASAGILALSVVASGPAQPRWANAALRSHVAAVPLVYEVWSPRSPFLAYTCSLSFLVLFTPVCPDGVGHGKFAAVSRSQSWR